MTKRLDCTTLQHEYPDRGKQIWRQLIPLQPLLQRNYGEELDCTITSMACIFGESRPSHGATATTGTRGAPIP